LWKVINWQSSWHHEWFKMLDETLEKLPSQLECVLKRLAASDLVFSPTHVDTSVLKGGSSEHTSLLRAITLSNHKMLWL
jgi:hypothetical protein